MADVNPAPAAEETVQKVSLNDLQTPTPIQPVTDGPAPLVDQPPVTPAGTEPTPPVTPEPEPEPPAPTEEELTAAADDVAAQLEFFEEVNRVRGVELKVEYGDIPPNSVEGIAIRERAIEADAVRRAEANLAAADPRGAAYLLHRRQGGTDEEFFGRKSLSLPSYELFTDNVDLQKLVYKNDLVNRGLSSENADALVDMAVKNNTILAEADKSYKAQEETDRRELARLAAAAEQEQQAWKNRVKEIDNVLSSTLTSKELKVVIPDSEQKDFDNFVRNMIQTDGQDFYIAQTIDPKTMATIIESLYIQFKKGDLSAVITRAANSLNVKRNQIPERTDYQPRN
jgi:hypothetical protein